MGHKKTSLRDKFLQAAELAPDPLLPEQLFERDVASSVQGERKLMAAVLLDAIRCYAEHLDSPTRQGARLFREAQEWIFKDDFDWLYSFQNICLALDIDSSQLRKRLQRIAHGGPHAKADHFLTEALKKPVDEEEAPEAPGAGEADGGDPEDPHLRSRVL